MLQLNKSSYKNEIRLTLKIFERPLNSLHDFLNAIEFQGDAVEALSIESRMTMCNMAIEAGARAGFVAVDDKTIEYVKGRPYAPTGDLWDQAEAYWRTLHSDDKSWCLI